MDISYLLLPPQHKIAQKFGCSYDQLSSLIYPETNKSYRNFIIPKKNGEQRIISAPNFKLLKIQQTLAKELMSIYSPRKSAHGFIKNRSIITNAQKHIKKRYVFNVDLKDFFGSIHFGRVRNLLMSKPFNYTRVEATILSQICCYNGVLPQGAPTSPIISNIICWKLDAQLQQLAFKNKCTYTRYADDLTFSFDVPKGKLPRSIIRINSKDEKAIVGSTLLKIIKDNGFKVNEQKVRLQGRNQRQEVTGITVNNKVNLKRAFIRRTASMLHAWKKFGAIAAEKQYIEKYRKKNTQPWQKEKLKKADGSFFINVVKGRVNYILMVRGRNDPVYRKLAFQLTEALGVPNKNYQKSHQELSTFVIEKLVGDEHNQGTGFLLEGVGIVTNRHVVEGITNENYMLYNTFRCYEENSKKKCSLIYVSKDHDIAILKPVEEWSKVTPYKMGIDKYLQTGDEITVVGFPGFSPGATPYICQGKITSQKKLFQSQAWIVDAPINHGCSGGAILNNRGEVIGIATFGKVENDGSTECNGFIPISSLQDVLKSEEYIKYTYTEDNNNNLL